jgi:hypothetical protein
MPFERLMKGGIKMDYPDDEYTDEEEAQEVMDEQREQWEDAYGTYPQAKRQESLFSLFKDTWRALDSSKIANIDKNEIGDLGISVRDSQRIALLARLLHHDDFAKYFANIGEITLATSMSRKGWFTELFVTSKKFAQKGVIENLQGKQPQKKKWTIFGKPQEPAAN